MEERPFPNGAIRQVKGNCIVLNGDDIDTDRIIPARFLKCVSFEDLGDKVFRDDREEQKGQHPFDQQDNKGSSILIVNRNFGCGSSREHAPQALMRWGIRAIIGESFAEIFLGNCLALGIPCATMKESKLKELQNNIKNLTNKCADIDLASKKIKVKNDIWNLGFDLGALEMLVSGRWDATSLLLRNNDYIEQTINNLPYLNRFKL